ncbi:myosin heavy chain [Populus alba x Populus x berolinensis]|nr:myosin heavy chain [Populus alba x Populus x berolinensis]
MNSTRGTHNTATLRRRRRNTTGSVRRKLKIPPTPFLHWKFLQDDNKSRHPAASGSVASGVKAAGQGGVGVGVGGSRAAVSARKLAAGLWNLCLAGGGGGDKALNLKYGKTDELGLEIESPLLYSKHIMEGAMKWEPRCSRKFSDICSFYSHTKLLENQVAMVSASAMQEELVQARLRIHELEAECQSYKKKVKNLQKKLGEERTSWQSSERQKIHAVIDGCENKISRERKKRQKLELLNYKLVNELSNVKSSAKQFREDYEEEQKAREIMEEVCNELAYKVAEDKAEVETFKTESIRIQEEMEEERKMLQMAEVWREERVQMKLIDAKLALEDKDCQMNRLITDLETFLRSRSGTLDVNELRKAELIRQAAKLVNVKDIKEFSYAPPKLSDIYSIYEELKQIEDSEREIEECKKSSPASNASELHLASSDLNAYNYHSLQQGSTIINDDDRHLEEDARGYDAVSHAEGQGSSYSHEGNQLSVSRLSQSKNAWQIARECDENEAQNSPNTQSGGVNSVSGESMHKESSISKLSRSAQYNNKCYEITADDSDGVALNGKFSNKETSPRRKSWEGPRHQDSMEQWSSPDSHVTQGIKKRFKWSRGIQKNSLKAKLLEARMESQKAQLRSVLKQKT